MKQADANSPSLAELQQAFQLAVLVPQDPPRFIADAPGVQAAERFGVYAEAYRLRLVEALAADFPALQALLGDAEFDALGRGFIDAQPSGHFSIRWFGRGLPGFLAEAAPHRDQPFLYDLAAFEWALSEAFDAADTPGIGPERLAGLDPALWPLLRLEFHPCLRCLALAYNTPEVWKALSRDEPPPEPARLESPQTWAVWRRELRLFFRPLSVPEAWALAAFARGLRFAEVCEGLCDWLEPEQVAPSAAGFLQSWMQEGWIIGVGTD